MTSPFRPSGRGTGRAGWLRLVLGAIEPWWMIVLAATAMALGLQAARVFVADLVFVVDQSRRTALALYSVGVFFTPALAGLMAQALGSRRLLLLSALGLWLSRLALQVTEDPPLRVLLGAIGLAGWGWLLVGLLSLDRRSAGLGLLAGCALDLAVRTAAPTIDLPWMPGPAAHLATSLLIGAGALSLLAARWEEDEIVALPGTRAILVGPFLALFHLALGNLGLAQVQAGLRLPAAALVLGLGLAGGMALGRLVARHWVGWVPGTVSSGLGLWLVWHGSRWAALGLLLSAAGSAALLAGVLLSGRVDRERGSIGRIALGFAVGLLIQVGLLFGYYTATGSGVYLGAAWLLTSLGATVWWPSREPASERLPVYPAALAAGALVALAAGWQELRSPASLSAAPLSSQITVMTYNIQSGFARDNRWSLEEIARTIEATQPDIVVLQEVSRGWLVTNGADNLLWLSRRLGMWPAWGPASADGLWGNAILTRSPVTAQELWRFSQTQNLRRSALAVRVEAGGGSLWVIGTHLDDPRGAGAVRLAQVEELVDFWAGRVPVVIAGDLNAEPEDAVIARLLEAGLVDSGASLGPEATTSEDGRRIDYLLVSPEVTVLETRVLDRWSSDHRPVVATLRMPWAE